MGICSSNDAKPAATNNPTTAPATENRAEPENKEEEKTTEEQLKDAQKDIKAAQGTANQAERAAINNKNTLDRIF